MMISTRLLRAVFGALALLSAFAPERAVGQPLMTYQGRLKESGVPVNGNRTIEVMLCNCLTGLCAPACTSTGAQGVTVSSGLFRTTFTVPSGVDLAAPPWYLEIKVNASALSPREELTYSPYAVFASSIALNTVKTANIINGAVDSSKLAAGAVDSGKLAANAVNTANIVNGAVDSSKLAPSFLSSIVLKAGDTMTGQLTNTSTITVQGNAFSVGGSTFVVSSGNIGIGTTVPGAKLHVSGPSNFEGDVAITTGSASGGSHLRSSQPANPAGVASNPGCGTTGPTVAIAGTDMAGGIQLNTSTAPSGVCTVTVTFVRPYVTAPKSVVISPMGPNAGTLNAFIQIAPTTSGFVLQAANAVGPTAQYNWSYIVIE